MNIEFFNEMVNTDLTDDDLILVTGATGFLASHIIKQLLELGYRVRATVRNLQNDELLFSIRNLVEKPKYKLELVKADLMKEDSWIGAVENCTYVIHTANPMPNDGKQEESELVQPAVNGIKYLLNACYKSGSQIKRVIYTSSTATVSGEYETYENGKVYNENDYASPETSQPYIKGKILAERAAWEFIKTHNNCFELSVINPGFIIGPILLNKKCSSMTIVENLLMCKLPIIPDLSFSACDVRTVALAHIVAMKSVEALSNRHIICSNDSYSMLEFANWLEEEFNCQGYRVKTRLAPNWVFKMLQYLDARVKFFIKMIGKKPKYDNSRLINELKIEPMNERKALIEMAYSMIEKGFIVKI